MRRNSCTVVVLSAPVPAAVLAAVDRSMNVTLVRPAEPAEPAEPSEQGADGVAVAAEALRRAARAASPYALVAADPLAAVAAGWRFMWDLSRPQGPDSFELAAARVLSAWRAGLFELPDYYLVPGVGAGDGNGSGTAPRAGDAGEPGELVPDFHLGPLRAARPHRVEFVPETEPAGQAAGVLHALGSLRHGPWWPGLDELIGTARTFYPASV